MTLLTEAQTLKAEMSDEMFLSSREKIFLIEERARKIKKRAVVILNALQDDVILFGPAGDDLERIKECGETIKICGEILK